MKKIILSFFIASASIVFSQNENNTWYFGQGAGIDFNSGSPVSLGGGQTNILEGTAVASDKTTGLLLFYTDGIKVWNKNHVQMPNGSGLNGHTSSSQSALIVPVPANSNLYYIFTVGSAVGFNGGYAGLCYSVVNMSLNGGTGDVTVKNQVLLTTATEKLTAIRNPLCEAYWVVAHGWNSNAFYAYPLTASGIGTPQVSNVGMIHQDIGSGNNSEAIGYMRISPNGTRLAVACFINLNTVEIFDFSRSTGVVSNAHTIDTYPVSYNNGPYGVCFSPDNSRLYVSHNAIPSAANHIWQYDLTAGSDSAITASKTTLSTTNSYRMAALQIGPDNKIYVTKYQTSALDVITNPNGLGAASNYVTNGFPLASGMGYYGLPNFTELPPCTANLIDEEQGSSSSIYPNPVLTEATLQTEHMLDDATLTIYNCVGQAVTQMKNISGHKVKLYLGDLSKGLYLVRLMENDKVISTDKLIIID